MASAYLTILSTVLVDVLKQRLVDSTWKSVTLLLQKVLIGSDFSVCWLPVGRAVAAVYESEPFSLFIGSISLDLDFGPVPAEFVATHSVPVFLFCPVAADVSERMKVVRRRRILFWGHATTFSPRRPTLHGSAHFPSRLFN
jgi:hypothetical protein